MAKYLVRVVELHNLEINAPDESAAEDFALESFQQQVTDDNEFYVDAVEDVGTDTDLED